MSHLRIVLVLLAIVTLAPPARADRGSRCKGCGPAPVEVKAPAPELSFEGLTLKLPSSGRKVVFKDNGMYVAGKLVVQVDGYQFKNAAGAVLYEVQPDRSITINTTKNKKRHARFEKDSHKNANAAIFVVDRGWTFYLEQRKNGLFGANAGEAGESDIFALSGMGLDFDGIDDTNRPAMLLLSAYILITGELHGVLGWGSQHFTKFRWDDSLTKRENNRVFQDARRACAQSCFSDKTNRCFFECVEIEHP